MSNAQALARRCKRLGLDVLTGGTDNQLVILDLTQHEIDGARLEKMLASMALIVLKHTLPNQVRHRLPLGIRIGTGAMTLRGFCEAEFEVVAEMIASGIEITQSIIEGTQTPSKNIMNSIDCNSCGKFDDLIVLRKQVDEMT